MITVRGVVIDIGGVLVHDRLLDTASRWAGELALSPAEMLTAVYGGNEDTVLIGRVSEDEWWEVVRSRLGIDTSGLRAALESGQTWQDELVAVLREVKPSARTAILSNAWPSQRSRMAELERSLKELPGDVVSQAFVLDSDTRPLAVDTEERPPGVIFIAGDPARFRPELVDVLTDPLIVGLTQELLGVDEIQCHFTNITTKAPRIGRAISWHRDYPNQYMCPQRSSFLRVMVCLDGMDEGNGGTCFVPGSHLVSDDEAAAMGRTTTEPPSSDVEVATCPPGSLVFIHPKVLHGGSRNASDRPRRNLIAQWGPADEPVCLYSEAESLTGLRATRDPSHIRRDLAQRRRDRPDPPLLSPARTTQGDAPAGSVPDHSTTVWAFLAHFSPPRPVPAPHGIASR